MSAFDAYDHPSDGPDPKQLRYEFGQACWRASRREKILRTRAFVESRGEWAPPEVLELAREELSEIEVLRAPFDLAFFFRMLPALHDPPRTPFDADQVGGSFLYRPTPGNAQLSPMLKPFTLQQVLDRGNHGAVYFVLRLVHTEVAPGGEPVRWSEASIDARPLGLDETHLVFHDPRWMIANGDSRLLATGDANLAIATAREFTAVHRVASCVGEVLARVSTW